MKFLFLYFIFVFISSLLFSQDYQTVKTGNTSFFIAENGDINAIRIDSTIAYIDSTVLFPFNTIRKISDSCYNPYGHSWIGRKVVILPDGWNLFFNRYGDTLRFNTRAKISESWDFGAGYTAVVSSSDTLTFSGITDSVKTIILIKDTIHRQIVISKNYGLISTAHIYHFPGIDTADNYYDEGNNYSVIGMTNPVVGFQTSGFTEFSFEIGDEFHLISESNSPPVGSYTSLKYILQVIDKKIIPYQDTIFITYTRCGRKIFHNWTSGNTDTIYYYDTVVHAFPELATDSISLPKETRFESMFSCNLMRKTTDYNGRIVLYYDQETFKPGLTDTCAELYHSDPPCLHYSVHGCGGTYYDCKTIDQTGWDLHKLCYFKKGGETWGVPFNCLELLSIPENKTEQKAFTIYPNPVKDIAYFDIFTIPDHFPLQLSVYNPLGELVRNEIIPSSRYCFQKHQLERGVYFCFIYGQHGEAYKGKLMVE